MSFDQLPAAETAEQAGRTLPAAPLDLLRQARYGRLATSMRALPFLAVARHIVSDGRILLRMHSGFGHHAACDGSVVAYGADNYNDAALGEGGTLWSVQFTGPAELVHPCPEQEELFGAAPVTMNGEPYAPAYLGVDPRFVTEHTLSFTASPPIHHAA
ncbi:pyridoxamine 5'-phosphate oxidase family protein [Streptomyces pratensis]|uniref:pyridoxamine 5'-phosphate oxidase family protein n=1 Tax=Streptomyces pratensis TaxID=1169025 RepID=UPI0030180CEC